MNELLTFLSGPMGQYLILTMVFLAAASIAAGLAILFLRPEAIGARLNYLLTAPGAILRGRSKLTQEESTGLVAKVTKPLHKLSVPSEEAIRKKVRLKLIQAGFRSNQAYRNFLAAKTAGTVLLPTGLAAPRSCSSLSMPKQSRWRSPWPRSAICCPTLSFPIFARSDRKRFSRESRMPWT